MTCEYLREFSKKFETVLIGYSGAGGELIHEKTRSKKSRDTVPLRKERGGIKGVRGRLWRRREWGKINKKEG